MSSSKTKSKNNSQKSNESINSKNQEENDDSSSNNNNNEIIIKSSRDLICQDSCLRDLFKLGFRTKQVSKVTANKFEMTDVTKKLSKLVKKEYLSPLDFSRVMIGGLLILEKKYNIILEDLKSFYFQKNDKKIKKLNDKENDSKLKNKNNNSKNKANNESNNNNNNNDGLIMTSSNTDSIFNLLKNHLTQSSDSFNERLFDANNNINTRNSLGLYSDFTNTQQLEKISLFNNNDSNNIIINDDIRQSNLIDFSNTIREEKNENEDEITNKKDNNQIRKNNNSSSRNKFEFFSFDENIKSIDFNNNNDNNLLNDPSFANALFNSNNNKDLLSSNFGNINEDGFKNIDDANNDLNDFNIDFTNNDAIDSKNNININNIFNNNNNYFNLTENKYTKIEDILNSNNNTNNKIEIKSLKEDDESNTKKSKINKQKKIGKNFICDNDNIYLDFEIPKKPNESDIQKLAIYNINKIHNQFNLEDITTFNDDVKFAFLFPDQLIKNKEEEKQNNNDNDNMTAKKSQVNNNANLQYSVMKNINSDEFNNYDIPATFGKLQISHRDFELKESVQDALKKIDDEFKEIELNENADNNQNDENIEDNNNNFDDLNNDNINYNDSNKKDKEFSFGKNKKKDKEDEEDENYEAKILLDNLNNNVFVDGKNEINFPELCNITECNNNKMKKASLFYNLLLIGQNSFINLEKNEIDDDYSFIIKKNS